MNNSTTGPFEDINSHYIKNAIIPPPETPGEIVKFTRIVIDSKDRDKNLYPFANKYEMKLANEVTDVMSAKLLSADVPLAMYMINDYFNTLNIVYNGTDYTVVLDNGNYTDTGLATMMTTRLNAIVGSNTFSVSFNTNTDNYTFAAAQAFSMTFGASKNSLDALLGFAKQQYTSGATGSAPYANVIKSVYRKNFNYNNYAIMYIDQFDTYQSPSTQLDRSFAIIPAIYQQLNFSDQPELKKTFSPPIPRFTRLFIRFYDRYGNLYDFQNMEHRFEILLQSNKQARRYNSIFGN
jgi:hypothetical protein